MINHPTRILTKMATGSACCNVFCPHVRHVEASHLKLAKGLGSEWIEREGPGRNTIYYIFLVILKMANGVDYQCKNLYSVRESL